MFYNENMPQAAAKVALTERRIKLTEIQDRQLIELSERTSVPISALVRMALDSFIPKLNNSGFTEKGIKSGYINRNY